MSFDILKESAPWEGDTNWARKDPLLNDFEKSILKREPRLFYTITEKLAVAGLHGLLTIKGPRRVGKSTLLKLIIR